MTVWKESYDVIYGAWHMFSCSSTSSLEKSRQHSAGLCSFTQLQISITNNHDLDVTFYFTQLIAIKNPVFMQYAK